MKDEYTDDPRPSSAATEGDPSRAVKRFTALDWIGVVVTALAAIGIMIGPQIVGPPMVSMYQDFEAALPTITLLVISGWFPLLLGQLPLAVLLLAMLRRHSLFTARMLVVVGFVLPLLFGALCFYGFYAPIFDLAGAIEEAPSLAEIPAPERIVAIGDLHGDLDATRRALRLAGAIDEQDRWVGGDLMLVQTGDTIDRGDQDREVLDLLHRLIRSAPASGGAVIALNGNHELMNTAGDLRYITPAAMAAFDDLGGRARAFAPGSEYALRFAEQDVITKIGGTVFVHGAVLPEHVEYGIERLNLQTREWLRGARPELPSIMQSEDAPVWDRRFSDEAEESDCAELERTLSMLDAARLVVGHEAQEQGITSACGGKGSCVCD